MNNAELAETVDTTDEWIVERTGIRSRYIAGEGETTATLADRRRARALDAAGLDAADIDLIVLATATPDQTFPSSATKVQATLGIDDCIAFDVHAVCTGFLYALTVADSMLRSGNAQQGAGHRRRDVQPDPRLGGSRAPASCSATAPARWCSGAEEAESGILATRLHADGRHNDLLFVDGGPSTTGTVGKLRMKGREVFRHAVVNLAEVLNEVLDAAGLTVGRRRLGRPAPGQCAHPRRDGEQARACRPKKSSSPSTATPIRPRRRFRWRSTSRSRRANQARRPHRAGSDGRWIYLGRSSAPLLINLEYSAKCRIADAAGIPLRNVIDAAGARREWAGEN